MTLEEQIRAARAESSINVARRRTAALPAKHQDRGMSALLKALLAIAAIIVIVGGLWMVVASAYRAQHCIYLMGHWLSVERTTNPLFCQ